MIDRETLESRKTIVNQAIESSAANHNALLGRRAEIQIMIDKLDQEAAAVESPVVQDGLAEKKSAEEAEHAS